MANLSDPQPCCNVPSTATIQPKRPLKIRPVIPRKLEIRPRASIDNPGIASPAKKVHTGSSDPSWSTSSNSLLVGSSGTSFINLEHSRDLRTNNQEEAGVEAEKSVFQGEDEVKQYPRKNYFLIVN